jgi:hypothetical protein
MTETADKGDRMDSLDAWLAAMPVKDVQERIKVLERELEVLRTLERQHRQRAGAPEPPQPVPARFYGGGKAVPVGKKRARRRVSPERTAIIEVLREHPEGMSPRDITAALQERGGTSDQNAIQTLLSRMSTAEPPQVVRVEYGRYQLPSPDTTARLLNGTAGGD